MPLTQIDPSTALVVIDLQKGVAGLLPANVIQPIIDRAARLAAAFRNRGLPVALINVDAPAPGRAENGIRAVNPPQGWTELVPQLNRQPDDICLTKRSWGAFLTTNLHEQLRERGVTQIVLAGVSTSIGVESTARSAYDLGYNVTFAIDAMLDRSDEAHRHSVETIFPRLGERGTTEEILELMG